MKRTLTIMMLAAVCELQAQVYKPVMVDSNGVVYRPANFWSANLQQQANNPYSTNSAIEISGTNLVEDQAASVVFTNVGVQPRHGLVTVMFENSGGSHAETAQFVFTTSASGASISATGLTINPTNRTPMAFGAVRSGSTLTLSFTNQNTNSVNWRIWVFGRTAP